VDQVGSIRPSLWQLFIIGLVISQRALRPVLDILNTVFSLQHCADSYFVAIVSDAVSYSLIGVWPVLLHLVNFHIVL